jgi:hypothetical protein
MRGRLSVLALVVLLSALAACSTAEDEQGAATTTTHAERTETRRTETGRGGLFGALRRLFGQDEIGRCVERVASSAGDSRPETLRAVAREVERLRRLRFRALPRPHYLRRQEMERRIRRELDSYPDAEAAQDGRALVALGAVPRGTNLKALLKRAVPGQVAGYYDPKTSQLVVAADAQKGLGAIEHLTLAHELEHALADQVLGLPRLLQNQEPPDGQEDVQLAGLSLVEGDATLLTEAFASEHLSLADAFRSLGPALASAREVDELPHYLRASMILPYADGLDFVCHVFERGGWKAVDRAYRRLPSTSAQILFPARYFAREQAADPPDARPPGGGWKLLDEQEFGAANLLWLFQAPGGETSRELSDARGRAAAWAGGELRVWGRRGTTAVILSLVERRGERDLCASMRAWLTAAGRRGVVRCSGRTIRASLHPS